MVPIKRRSDIEIECDYLMNYLKAVTASINSGFPSFHAALTQSNGSFTLKIERNDLRASAI